MRIPGHFSRRAPVTTAGYYTITPINLYSNRHLEERIIFLLAYKYYLSNKLKI